ncbi:MAG: DUF4402 domain-containing protein [Pseudomonadota bacterium]|nr:DUF4402 domain-containing protein [Pseudomonadota bacterium]
MTKFLTKSVLAATVALLATPALAAPAGTSTFDSKAKIVKPVTMTKVTDLDFGTTTMNPALVSATVTVGDADGSVAVCSSAQLTCSGGFPASFTLSSGVQGQTVQISFDNPPAKLDHTSLAGKSVPFSLDAVEDVLLDSAGAGEFNIGGEITVVSATADGEYKATVNIVANYL